MERTVGTVSRGIRAPIIREGDVLEQIVVDSVIAASKAEGFTFHEKDIIAVTEAVVARAQGNYATIDDIAKDIKQKISGGKPIEKLGVIFPILSRNRFAVCLKGIAKSAKKIVLMLSYPSDEVGNHLIDLDALDEKGIDPYFDVLTEERFRDLFGVVKHCFTGVDYIEHYKSLIEDCGAEAEIILANNPKAILAYTDTVICCDIHSRARTRRILKSAGAKIVMTLEDFLNAPVDGSGYNEQYGLLGSNKATEDKVKLFPRNCMAFVNKVQEITKEATGVTVEVMIYGDGAFKDPVGKIWELADPVVSPAYTSGLEGTPNEVKIKYLADNNFSDLSGDELKNAIKDFISHKGDDLVGNMESQGTTPRQLTDLIGTLSDLTSGSGDKGTPIVFIQGYFDNYTI